MTCCGVTGSIIDGVGAKNSSYWSSSSLSWCRIGSRWSSGGGGPRSSSMNLVKSSVELFKALMSSTSGVHCSKPKAQRNCSAVTKMLDPPLLTQACLPTAEGSQLKKVAVIQVPLFLPPRFAQRQKATFWPGMTSATLVMRVFRSKALRRCRLTSKSWMYLMASARTSSAL